MKNNNEQFENFIRDFDTIRMTNDEKNDIHENLELFTRSYIPEPSPYFNYVSFFKKTIAVTLVLLLVVSISKPVSAKSLPGELLYNIKIIHEKIEAATITKSEKKIDFEIKQTETRIREAVNLAKINKLNTVKQEKLAGDIRKHVKDVSDKIEVIKKESPEKALALNSDLKTTLKVNSKALEKAMEESEIERKESQLHEENENVDENEIVINEEVDINEDKDSEGDENITEIEEAIVDEEMLSKEDKEIIYTEESSVDMILNSIEEDIIKTELISENLKEEIIAEEDNEIQGDQENETNIEKPLPETIANQDEDFNEESEEDLFILTNQNKSLEENVDEEIESNEAVNVEIIQSININDSVVELEISDNLRLEIISLENILEAEERLKFLLTELSKERDEVKIELVRKLVEDKKLGQAYIEIQKEIELLAEVKLSRELGISEDGEKLMIIEEEKTQT